MGSSTSKPSSCKVRNRLGCPVQLDAVLSPPGDTSLIAAATSSRVSVKLSHGGEESIGFESHSPDGMLMSIRFHWNGEDVRKVFRVPNDGSLLLRAFDKGELAFRVTRVGDGGTEAAITLEGEKLQQFLEVMGEGETVGSQKRQKTGVESEAAPGASQPEGPSTETVVMVSDAPMCFATGSGEWVDADPAACDREEDLDELIETAETVDTTEMEIKDEEAPSHWTEAQRGIFAELREMLIPSIRARKAVETGCDDVEDAIAWLERHQNDDDIDVSPEMLRAREEEEVALAVLRLLTVPVLHRLPCLQAVHRVLHNILADPESSRVRQIRCSNIRFKERIGRFPPALALLNKIGFQPGDFWTSAYQREPCLEWRYPVGSANRMSQRMERAFSLLDEVLRNPDAWIPAVDLWAHVPGYESAEENEHPDCEGKIASQAKESLREVVKQLGDDWEELSVLFFKPAAKMKNKDKEKDREREFTNRVSSVLTPSFRIEHTDAPVVRDTLLSNGLTPTTGRDWLIQWSGPGLRDTAYQEMNEFQRVNHFPGSTELTRKDRLWMNFLDMAETFGNEAFDFVPQTFVLPEQVQEFLEVYNKKNGLWIVKPHASSRGRGIFVLKDVADLPLNEVSVVSQYVHNPLLIQGLKFDLRVYVLVTSYEPLRAYVYREGLVRFACRPYSKDPEHLSDAYRHLTNYSINKGSATFVENSEVQADNVGHKWSFSALNRHLKCTGVDVELMWSRIMDVIMKSLLAVEPVIGARTKATACHSHNCFELYGFDVLVDNELKPWLLEVNLSPSMQADSPLDWQIKGSLLADTFNLVGINRVSKHRLAEATRAKAKVLKIPGKPPGPPERHKAHRRRLPRHRSALLRRGLETMDATEEPMPPVALGALELEELRSAANALLECTRNRNFIRLFPTSRAVYHYAVIVDSQEAMKPWPRGRKPVDRLTSSQVLASLLFGPPPTHGMSLDAVPRSRAIFCCRRRPERPEEDGTAGQGEDGEETSTPLPRARAEVVKRVKSVATTGWEKNMDVAWAFWSISSEFTIGAVS
eukprot:symbB.v1.2.017649.t1/scaffold1373.1/size231899/14